ncbi:hypothetical protein JCM3766R1_000708 [Sporobolomyces carnicolor]
MISLGLSRITKLLQALKSPHCTTPVVHIAGTNGKGSVSAYLASILHAADIRVGRFNSPHLVDEWDCVRLNEKVVEESLFRRVKAEVETVNREESLEATPFEVLTATAFALFARSNLDLAVVEVGMGGESDATNVVPASKTLLSILTAVDLDHQGFLGNTVEEIAKVKSGIVRESGDLVVSRQAYPEVVEVAQSIAIRKGATVWQAAAGRYLPPDGTTSSSRLRQASIPLAPSASSPNSACHTLPSSPPSFVAQLPLPGSYQLDNSATAALAIQLLRSLPRTTSIVPRLATIRDGTFREGVERTMWDGRLQWIDWSPSAKPSKQGHVEASRVRHILLDGAHNPSSARLLSSYLGSLPKTERPSTLVFALSAPRNPWDVLEPLLESSTGIDRVVCVEFSPPSGMPWVRATPSEELHRSIESAASRRLVIEHYKDIREAFSSAQKLDDSILVAGSLYLVADALRMIRERS